MKNLVLEGIRSRLLIAGIICTGLFMFTADLNAQHATPHDLYEAPEGDFVVASIAVGRLDAELAQIRYTINNLTPGSHIHYEWEAKYAYYDAVKAALLDSKSGHSQDVANAIAKGAHIFSTEAWSSLSKTLISSYRENLINLLKA